MGKDMIKAEVDLSRRKGPDVGYNEEQKLWIDSTSRDSSMSRYSPAGNRADGDYRIVLIKTAGAGKDMETAHQHFDANLMHIRTGIADFLSVGDGQIIPTAANPDKINKFLAMIELQSDWLQHLRKGYSSRAAKNAAAAQQDTDIQTLKNVTEKFVNDVSASMWNEVDNLLKPLVGMSASDEWRAEGRDLAAQNMFGMQWDNISVFDQLKVWQGELVKRAEDITGLFDTAVGALDEIIDAYPSISEDIIGSMDARMFDRLDKAAAAEVARHLRSSLIQARDFIRDMPHGTENQDGLERRVDGLKRDFMSYFMRQSRTNSSSSSMRIPLIGAELKTMLEPVYTAFGVDTNGLTDAIDGMKERSSSSALIPIQVFDDLSTATNSNQTGAWFAHEMFSHTNLTENDIVPRDIGITVSEATPGFIELKLSGDKGALETFHEKLPEIIKKWVKEKGVTHFELQKARTEREAQEVNRSTPDFDEVEEHIDWKEIAVDDSDLSTEDANTLAQHSIQTYEAFEEEHFTDELESQVEGYIENFDWDETDYNRDSEEYRTRIEVDEDGDANTDDAEEWLTEGRAEYEREQYDDDEMRSQAYDAIRERWESDFIPFFGKGELPVEWDADGDVTKTVYVLITNEEHGGQFDIWIDGDKRDYEWNPDDAKNGLANEIGTYYEDNNILPPYETPYNQDAAPEVTPEPEAEPTKPNWDIVANNIVSVTEAMSGNTIQMDKIFSRMVKFKTTSDAGGHGVFKDTPLSGDKEWRTIALRYLLSDAVRRGFPGIIWSEGLSSGKRGGNWGMSSLSRVSRLSWKKETMTLQGQEKDVIVINSPDLGGPLVVAPDKMIPILGTKLTSYIYQQMNGEMAVAPALVEPAEGEQGLLFEGQSVSPRNYFLVSQTSSGTFAIHRRDDNKFIGFAKSQEDADQIMQNAFDGSPEAESLKGNKESSEMFGEALAAGVVTEEMFGGQMNLVTGDYTDHYAHTYGQPKTASARESYEKITVSIWNNELKKYGAKIGRTTIYIEDVENAVYEEGISVTRIKTRDKAVEARHGSITVEELTGETHGWIIVSAKDGPVYERVYTSRAEAEVEMRSFITDNFGSDKGGSEVFYIEINDALRDEFSGPVAPFHYDPSEDPDLKDMAKRFGAEVPRQPFLERWAGFKADVNASWQQGLFDSFYGIKRAMEKAGVHVNAANNPYIQARMSTSLDSVMKGALLFGHPVWKDGIVQNEGKGLAEILRPIMNDTKPWEMYMYAKRAKRLMLEGYAQLDGVSKQRADAAIALSAGANHDEKLWNLLVAWKDGTLNKDRPPLPLNDADKGALSDLEVRYYHEFLPHMQRSTKKSSERDIVWDWRIPTTRNKQTVIDLKRGYAVDELMDKFGVNTKGEANRIIDKITELGLKKQGEANKVKQTLDASRLALTKLVGLGREHRFDAAELQDAINLNDKFPQLERVAKDWAVYNSAVLDLAEQAGTINKESRALWESADYVPFHSLDIDGTKGIAGGQGVANVKSPIQRLFGSADGDLDIIHNIMTKTTTMIEGAMKNHAALMAIDTLKGSGIVSKAPKQITSEMIPMSQLKEHFKAIGVDPKSVPPEMFEGLRKMIAVHPPSGDGVLSVLRDGKREYWETVDPILFRAMTALNKEVWDNPLMTAARGNKRFFTSWITLDPGFMARNFARDTGGAYILARDGMIPIASAIKGFKEALLRDESYRVLLGSGAAFENGYVTASDPRRTRKILKRAMRSTGFVASVIDSPRKALDAYKALSSAIENANRIAVYNAAIRAGKSKAQASFEAKDLMDFTMGGDWPAVQFLIQTVPFIGARMQGLHRLGRGFVENPAGFTLKASLLTAAALAVWFAYRDDERYKELEDWDKDTYIHWWVGDAHYRLPKPFEIGALFMTVPERIAEYMYSNETDAGKLLLKRMGHMFSQTFSLSPIPQLVSPLVEMGFNHDLFRGREIVNYFEEQRLPPEQRRHYTSPTMAWLGANLPNELDTASLKIRSPLHLQHFYEGYTATIGKYLLMATDAVVRSHLDLPLPPSRDISDWPGVSSFYRGENEYRKTKYEEEVWDLLRKTTQIQGSLNFHEKQGDVDAYLRTHEDYLPYVKAASTLEGVREDVQDINRAQMQIYLDPEMSRDDKKVEDDKLQKIKNELMKEAFELRPGGKYNPLGEPVSQENIIDMIDEFGVDDSAAYNRRLKEDAPATHELLQMIDNNISQRGLQSLAKVTASVNE
jgi:hypothetical protein